MASSSATERPVHWIAAWVIAAAAHVMVLSAASSARVNTHYASENAAFAVEVNMEPQPAEPVPDTVAQHSNQAPSTNQAHISASTPVRLAQKVSPVVVNPLVQSRVLASAGPNISAAEPEVAAVVSSEPGSSDASAIHHGTGSLPQAASNGNTQAALANDVRAAQTANQASKPRLLSRGTTCQGVFAESTDVDKVTMVLTVDTDGTALPTAVRTASPASSAKLRRAALSCARRLRFVPAHDADGRVVVASSIVSLTISKRHAELPARPRRKGTT